MTTSTPTSTPPLQSSNSHLIRPSSHVPWDVQVTGVVPSSIVEELPQATQGCTHGTWACLLIGRDLHVFQMTSDAKPFKLYHPNLNKKDLLISMHSTTDCVHVYAATPSVTKKTLIMVWVVRTTQRVSGLGQSPTCKAVVEGVSFTNMTAMESGLVLGTATNQLHVGHLNPKPVDLAIQKLTKSNSSGIMTYVFGSAVVEDPIKAVLVQSKNEILAVTTTGHVERYTIKRKAGILSCDHAVLGSLKALMGDPTIQIIQATTAKDRLHVICLVGDKLHYVDVTIHVSSLSVNTSEWLCRFHATVQCTGLVATENDMVYAVLSYPDAGGVACLALNKAMEVDLPSTQVPSVFMLGKDNVTHGCHMITSTGLLVRARWIQLQKTKLTSTNHNPMLVSHLASSFWHWYRSASGGMPLPPSLQTAKPADLEAAIVVVAQQIQQEGDTSSLKNPMEWHLNFIKFLKENGLYRSVSNQGRWNLMGIGQELAVHATLGSDHPLVKDLLPHGVATKLQLVQEHVLQFSMNQNEWCDILRVALETAQQYRVELAVATYDVLSNDPVQLWTHNSTLQQVLVSQLEYWRDSNTKLDQTQVKVVAKVALSSFMETDHKHYEQLKTLAIPLVQAVKDDVMAFDLSEEHRWFVGLCQLSLEHRKEDYFQIDTLLREWDESFGKFVLQWHADRRKYGQMLRHGEHVPTLLSEFLETDDRLKQYRWIHSGRMHDFDTSASQLMENGASSNNLHDAKWSYSMALLANKVSKHPTKRQKVIDAKLDFVKAQEVLSEEDDGPLRTSEQLLNVAMDKLLNHSATMDESIQLCMVGLSIAKAEDDSNTAARVWSLAILKDRFKWEQWITTKEDLTSPALRNLILDTTVFGGLWKLMQGLSLEYHSVQYDTPLEKGVIEALGFDAVGQTEMKRLLRSVTTVVLSGSKSLMVAQLME